jgi:surface polysaccharide O-acyltransferase-like enzyme
MERRKNKSIEFSKVIAIVMLVVFVLTFIVAWVTYILQDKISTELLSFISTPLMIIVTGYYVKAGTENINKINK